jgi:hypothetical protein
MLPRMKSTYTTVLWITTLAFGFICWKNGFPQTAGNWLAIVFSSVCGGVVGMLLGVAFSVISILFMASEKNGILGEHEYTISPAGLLEKTSANRVEQVARYKQSDGGWLLPSFSDFRLPVSYRSSAKLQFKKGIR